MGPYDSCRLMHINLAGFVKKDKDGNNYFDFEELEQVAYENMRLCDDLVDLELEHVDAIIEHIKSTYTDDNRNELELWEKVRKTGASSRRAGCGATSLADACALVGLPMASKEGMAFIEKVFKTKMRGELRAQVDLAEERGTFTGYDFDKEFKYDENTHTYSGCNSFFDAICSNPDIMDIITFKRMLAFGRRNVSWSTMAPVGTGAIMHQGSSGVEPVFMPYYKRRKKCVSGEKPTFIDKEGIGFVEFPVVHKPLKEWIMEHGDGYNPELSFEEQFTDENAEKWVKQSPWAGSFAPELTPSEHVAIQAIVQRLTTHSISKCVTADTLIETSDGYFYIDELTDVEKTVVDNFSDLKSELKAKTHSGENKRISKFYNNGTKPVYELTLTNGSMLQCTGNERVIRLNEETNANEWCEVSMLNEGDRVRI